ncbi:MAG: hypothetical protein M1816_000430 [Peltula sp. TS41687]|nr:MAG: hypothetical protein M1816_000430 [Peltula sp. TS41687]
MPYLAQLARPDSDDVLQDGLAPSKWPPARAVLRRPDLKFRVAATSHPVSGAWYLALPPDPSS